MAIWEIILFGVGLAMDAFAVSVGKGLAIRRGMVGKALIIGLYFGAFQALMPLVGYFLGSRFSAYITAFDHWIAFVLLLLIGGNMIRETVSERKKEKSSATAGEAVPEEETSAASVAPRVMLVLAVATSIDALAVGVTMACLSLPCTVGWAAAIIGAVTFVISFAGVGIGHLFGARFRSGAGYFGGAILILIGAKILIEHLFF